MTTLHPQKDGKARLSFTSNLIEQLDREGNLTEEYEGMIKGAAATVYGGKMDLSALKREVIVDC